MDNTTIKANTGVGRGLYFSADCKDLLFIAMTHPNAPTEGGRFDHQEIQAIIDICEQWLKENPEKVEGWLNMYGGQIRYVSKEAAARGASPGRVACIPISYTIGQGLDDEAN